MNGFFVISGFLITSLLLKEHTATNGINLRHFYVRRFLRIFPVAYLFLIVLFIISVLFPIYVFSESYISSVLFIRNTSIILVSDWYTGHYWSLSLEEQFYLLCPFFLKFGKKNYTYFLFFYLLPVLLLSIYLIFIGGGIVRLLGEILFYMPVILIGSGFALFISKISVFICKIFNYTGIISICLFVLAYFILSNSFTILPPIFSLPLASFFVALIIVFNVQENKNFFYSVLNLTPVKYIGKLSYSLYIWQQLFTYKQPWLGYFTYSGAWWLNLVLLFGVSIVSYHCFEVFF